MIGQALGRMAAGMTEAADVLRALLKAEAETVRLGAARSLLDLGVKLREVVEFEERLAALERKAADESKPKIAT
jgi:HEAT repeat protein